jgi:hypothetical protein
MDAARLLAITVAARELPCCRLHQGKPLTETLTR